MIRACHHLARLFSVLALGVMLTACQNAGDATEAAGTVTPRDVGVNQYSLEDHKACVIAGHQAGTAEYQECRSAWVEARGSQGALGTAVGLGGFF